MTERRLKSRRRAAAMRGPFVWAAVLLLLGSALVAPRAPAQAMDHDVKAVLVVSAYGLVGGTVLGLAALPFGQDLRTVFMGSSLGLYLGIAVGLYYVYDRYEQNNPGMRKPSSGGQGGQWGGGPGELPDDAVERELRELALNRAPGAFEQPPGATEPLRISVPVLRF